MGGHELCSQICGIYDTETYTHFVGRKHDNSEKPYQVQALDTTREGGHRGAEGNPNGSQGSFWNGDPKDKLINTSERLNYTYTGCMLHMSCHNWKNCVFYALHLRFYNQASPMCSYYTDTYS